MKKIVQNRMVTVRVVGMLGTRALVELVDQSVAPHVSASKALIDAGFATEEKDIVAEKGSSMHTASGKQAVQQTAQAGSKECGGQDSRGTGVWVGCLFTFLSEQSHKYTSNCVNRDVC